MEVVSAKYRYLWEIIDALSRKRNRYREVQNRHNILKLSIAVNHPKNFSFLIQNIPNTKFYCNISIFPKVINEYKKKLNLNLNTLY